MRHIFLYSILTLLIQGCGGEWPPYYGELSEHYTNNKAVFERLNQKLRESEYTFVKTAGIGNIPTPNDYQRISAYTALDESREVIIDDGEWRELLEQTQLRVIRIDSGAFQCDLRSRLVVEERSYRAIYVQGERGLKQNCQPSHANIPCGKCYAPLNESWGIEYVWTDQTIVTATGKRVEAGELTRAEFDATVAEEVRRCRTEGYAEIGYAYIHSF